MTNAINQIMTSLSEVFAPMDAEVLAKSLVWIEARNTAVKEFNAAEAAKPQSERLDTYARYDRLFALAGGKTWFQVLKKGAAGRAEFMTKNCAAIAAKRNAMIAKKLEKAGVTEVTSTEYTRTDGGFDGCFVLQTNTGRKVATINTIYAGGYNIQCLHLRVLVKVK